MSPTRALPTHADGALLRSSLERDGDEVFVRESVLSSTYSVCDRSYKLNKPVPLGRRAPLTLAARAAACETDVERNATLAPGVMLGVLAIVPSSDGSGYDLAPADDERAIDHVVEMRRLQGTETMEALVRRDALTLEQALAVGAKIAVFHADAEIRPEGTDYRELVDRNFEALLPLVESLLPARERLGLQRFAAGFLIGWAAVLEARAKAGSVVSGHGDLRPGNVVFDSGRVLIVGRQKADELQVVDAADELGSLVTELAEITGDREVGDRVLAGYRDAGGAPEPEALLAFFGAYRAQVRARNILWTSDAEVPSRSQRADAKRLLARSGRLNWQARGPLVLLITGQSTSGKSTLAGALGNVSGLEVVSLKGQQGHDHAEVARRVASQISVIVDTTFAESHEQEKFIQQLGNEGVALPLVVECRAPADIRAARASRRRAGGEDAAIGRPNAPGQERFAAVRGISGEAHLAVDTRAVVAAQVDEVASWLDSLMAAGRSA